MPLYLIESSAILPLLKASLSTLVNLFFQLLVLFFSASRAQPIVSFAQLMLCNLSPLVFFFVNPLILTFALHLTRPTFVTLILESFSDLPPVSSSSQLISTTPDESLLGQLAVFV